MKDFIKQIVRWEIRILPFIGIVMLFLPHLLPDKALGKDFSHSLVLSFRFLILLFSFALAFYLAFTDPPFATRKTFSKISILGFLIFIPASLLRAPAVIAPADCPKGILSQVAHCEGNTSLFRFMNKSGYYAYVSVGTPKHDFCQAVAPGGDFQKNVEFRKFKGNRSFVKLSCENFGASRGHCYLSDFESTQWNTHFYRLAILSEDCNEAIYYTGSSRAPGSNLELISKFVF